MKLLFTILVSLFITFSYSQSPDDLQTIATNVSMETLFHNTIGKHDFNFVILENVFVEEQMNVTITTDTLCVDGVCVYISSPIYYLEGKSLLYKDVDFAFRLQTGAMCILYVKNNLLMTLEICHPVTKEYTQYACIKPEQ